MNNNNKISKKHMWEIKMNISFEKEKNIYIDLCDSLSWRRKKKIIRVAVESYGEWEKRIEDKISSFDGDLSELQELSKYLNLISKKYDINLIHYNQLIYQVISSIFVGLIVIALEQVGNNITQMIATWLGIEALFCVFSIGVIFLYNEYAQNKLSQMFYEDFKQIVDNKINSFLYNSKCR